MMVAVLPADSLHHVPWSGPPLISRDRSDDCDHWYLTRKEIEENSPSRKDGIALKREISMRKSYCTFLQDLGMKLKVPQVTIATSIIFCHRFFVLQSHAKNDRRIIATSAMFLSAKVEDNPRLLKDVIVVSYEIVHKKNSAAGEKIKQMEVFEQQKELILKGERLVLETLSFELFVQHPYKPLVEIMRKLKVSHNALPQISWNFVNDGLRTTLCLQFKPHHIAAGAIFLAAKFLKVKLPSDAEKVWWQDFGIAPHQLEEISNQMLELYEQSRVPQSQANEAEASTSSVAGSHTLPLKHPSANGEHTSMESVSKTTIQNDGDSAEVDIGLSDQKENGESNDHSPNDDKDETTDHKDWSQEAIKKIDKDKIKAAMKERKKKLRIDVGSQKGNLTEDEMIEHELEEALKLPADDAMDEDVS